MTGFRKRMVFALSVVVALAFAAIVYAYWKTNTLSVSSPVTSISTSYPLEMRTQLNKTEFQLGEVVTIGFSLKNISNRTIILHYSSWSPGTNDFSFNITDEDGEEVFSFSKNYAKLYIIRRYTLEPGAEKRGTFGWDQINNVIYEKAPRVFTNEKVPKGVYKVIGALGELSAITFADNGETIILGEAEALRTPPIMVRIT